MPCRYRAIFFDLDGTLISERAGVPEARAAVAAMLRDAGHAVSDVTYADAAQAVINAAIAANGGSWPLTFSRLDAITQTISALGIAAPDTDVAALAERYKQTRLQCVERLPAAIDVLEAAAVERPLGLITNGPSEEQRQKLRRSALERYFTSVTISGDLDTAKPDPEIFERAVASLAVNATQCVYVGNNFAADVVGATGAGLDAVWLAQTGEPTPVATAGGTVQPRAIIRALDELPAVLGLGHH